MKTRAKQIVIVVSEDMHRWIMSEAKRMGGWTANGVLVQMREAYRQAKARDSSRRLRVRPDRQDDAESDTTGV